MGATTTTPSWSRCETAGHAVVASAATVAISLLALVVIPVPFLRSMGIGGMLIPLVSTPVVLTLLPAMLGSIGPRVDWPRIRHEQKASRAWSAWARLVSNRRWIAAGVGFVLLALLIVPVFGIKVGCRELEVPCHRRPGGHDAGGSAPAACRHGVLTPLEILVRGRPRRCPAGRRPASEP